MTAETPAETIRRAIKQMRADAGNAPDSPWAADIRPDGRAWIDVPGEDGLRAWGMHGFPAAARHVASWHPAVALATADLLEVGVDSLCVFGDPGDDAKFWSKPTAERALRLARTYLGETP